LLFLLLLRQSHARSAGTTVHPKRRVDTIPIDATVRPPGSSPIGPAVPS
jgi:hypothetical protein